MEIRLKTMMAILAICGMTVGNSAIADDVGKQEYMTYCASCHGTAGTGDGPLASILTVRVPDLTVIARDNDGDFLFREIVEVVDGRSGIMGHGATMPVWGDRFMPASDEGMASENDMLEVRGRILSLVYYLESIQKK